MRLLTKPPPHTSNRPRLTNLPTLFSFLCFPNFILRLIIFFLFSTLILTAHTLSITPSREHSTRPAPIPRIHLPRKHQYLGYTLREKYNHALLPRSYSHYCSKITTVIRRSLIVTFQSNFNFL
jgi:hypothetical protein